MSCPKCKSEDGQMKNGNNRSGTQSYLCRHCNKAYTPEPKRRTYNDEVRQMAMKAYYSGVIPIPIRNMEKDILKSAGFNTFSKCAYP